MGLLQHGLANGAAISQYAPLLDVLHQGLWFHSHNELPVITQPPVIIPVSFPQSTNPSHSLPTSVLALMKYHNPVLCGAAAAGEGQQQVQPP